MSDYNFVKFTKIGSKTSNYSISLTGSYSFGFNSGFYSRESIKDYKKVFLFYDKNKKAVAFQFVRDENSKGAFKIVHSKVGTTGSVTAKSFITQNEIDKREYFGQKEPKKMVDESLGQIYVINLLEKNKQE
ncbi:hypothetical protein L6261_00900 [Candidatus Parcubacteria bacterium]|nr:hypothetical protein [Candidatus Parcubacteria bacterium]